MSGDRLFLGIPIDDETRRRLADVLRGGPELPGRPVPPRNWHLTVRFLGDTPPQRLERIDEALGARRLGPPLELSVGGFGAFPRPARARLLWAGIDDPVGTLNDLAGLAEEVARATGFAPEERPFRPHLTLSRLREPRDVSSWLSGMPRAHMPLRASELVLFRSELGSGAARYHRLRSYPLDRS